MWSIISNNCWGANLYQERGVEYNTPTVGLWFHADDYISLISDFRNIVKQPLRFTTTSRHGFNALYPIGRLGESVEIQFMHYESEDEAARKWTSRVARLPASDDDLYIKICDRDGFEHRHLAMFDKIPFVHKVGFFKRGRFDLSVYPWAIEVDSPHATVEDGLTLWFQTRETGAFDLAALV
jgi:uncharacterized protein (DUF1919 family)